jgi:hypothetical protein
LCERFEQALLKALKPGERAKFVVVMVMLRSDDDSNAYTFAVSSEGEGETYSRLSRSIRRISCVGALCDTMMNPICILEPFGMVSSRNFPGPGLGQVAGLLASLS